MIPERLGAGPSVRPGGLRRSKERCHTPSPWCRSMNDADRRLAALAALQRQVFTRDQALAAGLSARASAGACGAGSSPSDRTRCTSPVRRSTGEAVCRPASWIWGRCAGLGAVSRRPARTRRLPRRSARLPGPAGPEGPAHRRPGVARRRPSGRSTVRRRRAPSHVRDADRPRADRPGQRARARQRHRQRTPARLDDADRPRSPARRAGPSGRAGVETFDRVMQSAGVQSWLEREFLQLIERPGSDGRRSSGCTARMVATSPGSTSTSNRASPRRGWWPSGLPERRRPPSSGAPPQRAPAARPVVYFFTTEDMIDAASYVVSTLRERAAADRCVSDTGPERFGGVRRSLRKPRPAANSCRCNNRGGRSGRAAAGSAGDEVLGAGVVADDGGGGLLGLVLPAGLLAHLDAEAVGAEQAGDGGVVLQVGAGRVAPRVAAAAVLLAEETAQGRARPRRRSPTRCGSGGASTRPALRPSRRRDRGAAGTPGSGCRRRAGRSPRSPRRPS